jgi:hypothetical protein
MTESAGSTSTSDRRRDTQDKHPVWEEVVTFSLVSGDTTGLATIAKNGVLQKIIVVVPNMQSGANTLDVSLTDNGDNTIWSVTNLTDSTTYTYSVIEPLSGEVNVILGFTNPAAAATVEVTLRGI